MKTLISSFVPFAGRRTNLSQQAMARLKKRYSTKQWKEWGVSFVTLPVAFAAVQKRLNELLQEKYDYIIMSGENRRARKVLVERVALNVAHASLADNDGHKAHLAPVTTKGPLALMTSVDTEQIVHQMRRQSIPARTNHHAGTFVCNASFYRALQIQKKTIFLHLPGRMAADKLKRTHVERLADCLELAWMTTVVGE